MQSKIRKIIHNLGRTFVITSEKIKEKEPYLEFTKLNDLKNQKLAFTGGWDPKMFSIISHKRIDSNLKCYNHTTNEYDLSSFIDGFNSLINSLNIGPSQKIYIYEL